MCIKGSGCSFNTSISPIKRKCSIESSDKKWSGIYKKLTSINSGNILNLSNHEDINNYVIKN